MPIVLVLVSYHEKCGKAGKRILKATPLEKARTSGNKKPRAAGTTSTRTVRKSPHATPSHVGTRSKGKVLGLGDFV